MDIGTFFILGFVAFVILMIICNNISKKKRVESDLKANNATGVVVAFHTVGLPMPENTFCKLYSDANGIRIFANNQWFNLIKEKLISVSMKTETDIQKQYVSSAGGAIGGALLFGPVGALIGGRTKKKNIKDIHTYLIITYKDEIETKYIGFDITKSTLDIKKFYDETQKMIPQVPTQVNL